MYRFEYEDPYFSGKSHLKNVKDALDNILEKHQYDVYGRAVTSEKHGGVEKYTFNYFDAAPADQTHTQVVDANGNVTDYFYGSHGTTYMVAIVGDCSCGSGSESTNFEYDLAEPWPNLITKIEAQGTSDQRETHYTWDTARNLTSIRDPLGTQTFTYNSFGQILTHTDRMGGITTNFYDTAGNLEWTENPLGPTTTDPDDYRTYFTYTTPQNSLKL